MDIKDDIIKAFCEQLKIDPEFPASIVENLMQLLEADEAASQEKILEIIRNGCTDVPEDQEN